MLETEVDVDGVVDELTEVLRELIADDTVDLDDPAAVMAGIEAAASGSTDRPAADVALLLLRLDAALADGRATVEHLGLEVSDVSR